MIQFCFMCVIIDSRFINCTVGKICSNDSLGENWKINLIWFILRALGVITLNDSLLHSLMEVIPFDSTAMLIGRSHDSALLLLRVWNLASLPGYTVLLISTFAVRFVDLVNRLVFAVISTSLFIFVPPSVYIIYIYLCIFRFLTNVSRFPCFRVFR